MREFVRHHFEEICQSQESRHRRPKLCAGIAASGSELEFSAIVIWRIAHGPLVERWAHLIPPQPVKT
jgi:predicted ester cyclase